MNGLTSAPRPGQPALEPRAEYTPAAFDSPRTAWPAWSAPLALVSALVVAVVGALLVDLPALALGVNLSAQHLPDGLQIADTAVQDLGFVLVAVFFAQLGGRKVAAWQFGLRPTPLVAGGAVDRVDRRRLPRVLDRSGKRSSTRPKRRCSNRSARACSAPR